MITAILVTNILNLKELMNHEENKYRVSFRRDLVIVTGKVSLRIFSKS